MRSATQSAETKVAHQPTASKSVSTEVWLATDWVTGEPSTARRQISRSVSSSASARTKALGGNAAVPGVALVFDAGPLADVVEVALNRDFQVVHADTLLGGVDHEADGHAASDGGE